MQIIPAALFGSFHGKIAGRKSNWWITERFGKLFSGVQSRKRNYRWNPVTNEEAKNQQRMAVASKLYSSWQPTPEELAEFEANFRKQVNAKGGCHSRRGYFIRLRMQEMKVAGDLAADPSKNLQDWSKKNR